MSQSVAPAIESSGTNTPVNSSYMKRHHWLILGLVIGLAIAVAILVPILWYEYDNGTAAQDLSEIDQIWEEFLALTDRTYSSTEQQLERYAIVAENAVSIIEDENPFWAVNGLLDLTVAEFLSMLGSLNLTVSHWSSAARHTVNLPPAPISYDVCEASGCTGIKNQRLCGSCWAVSTTTISETAFQQVQEASQPTALSATPVLACDTGNGNNGCSGGYPGAAADWFITTGTTVPDDSIISDFQDWETEWLTYIPSCSDYSINTNASQSVFAGWKYGVAWYQSPDTIASLMIELGPAVVLVDASSWQFIYTSSIYNDASSCSSNLQNANHAIVLTGYGVDNGVSYWTIRNSWGGYWGNDGYLRIQQDGNICGITNAVMWLVPPSKLSSVCGLLSCST
jgi:hypothetical protein